MKVLLQHLSTMHYDCGLERTSHDRGCEAGTISRPFFEELVEKDNCGHEETYSANIEGFEESLGTDGSSSYSTPILSPASSSTSFKSCFSAFGTYFLSDISFSATKSELPLTSLEEDEHLSMCKQHHSLEVWQGSQSEDDELSPEHVDIEVECFDSKNNGDDFNDSIPPTSDMLHNQMNSNVEELSGDLASAGPPHKTSPDDLDEEQNAIDITSRLILGNIETDPLIWLPPDSEITDDAECAATTTDDAKWGVTSSQSRLSDHHKQERHKAMVEAMNSRFKFLVRQFLSAEGIPASMEESGDSWLDIASSLSWEAALLVQPDTNDGNPMDPGLYVKIKCVACGSPSQSQLIKGLVFKKNTAHRHMPSRCRNARLLLIQGVLGQKAVGLSSFDSMEQEMDYLKATIDMIDACHPDVVLVEKTVSRDIQEFLLEKGISLVYDMKFNRLKRISLCTGSPIISSAEIPISPELKQCDHFHIEKFFEEHMCCGEGGKRQNKTLMFFEGCPKPLGCTILLKGDQNEKLKRVKRVIQSAVSAAYHLILETSFLADQRAIFSDIRKINYSLSDDSISTITRNSSTSDRIIPSPEQSSTCTLAYDMDISIAGDMHGNSPKEEYFSKDTVTEGENGVGDIAESKPGVSSRENCPAPRGLHDEVPDHGHFEQASHFNGRSNVEICGLTQFPKKGYIDNILDNQGILILRSRQCVSKGIICERNHLSRIKYYGKSDVSLGQFLQEILLNKEKSCSACSETPQAHSYSYTHHNGNLTVMIKRIPPEKRLPGEAEGKIWMWARCTTHGQGHVSPRATRRVMMSKAGRGLSFGKFLELSFSSRSTDGKISRRGHLLYRDRILFFGSGSSVALFMYSSIDIYTACQPPPVLDFSSRTGQDPLDREASDMLEKGKQLFSDVANLIVKIKSEPCKQPRKNHGPRMEFHQVEKMWREEKCAFEDSLTNIMNKNQALQSGHRTHSLPFMNQVLLLELYIWDRRIDSLCSVQTEDELLRAEEVHTDGNGNGNGNGNFNGNGEDFSSEMKQSPPTAMSSSPPPERWNTSDSTQADDSRRSLDASISDQDHLRGSHGWIWEPFSDILRAYEGDLSGGSSQKFDFIQNYTPLHLPPKHQLVSQYREWMHFPVGIDGDVISVCEEELSSIIAFALGLAHEQHLLNQLGSYKSTDNIQNFGHQDHHLPADGTSNHGLRTALSCPSALSDELLNLSGSLFVDHLLFSENLHPETRVPIGRAADKTGFAVVCLFAEQFRSLRARFCPSETAYISSIARCKKWNAQGGKSKALFAKSLDGRLIIKQISRTELDSFLRFAPDYFKCVSSSLSSGSQMCLAKILGMYQVKRTKNGKETKTDVVVMENLLYGRSVSRVYDLKGAVFSRYVPDGDDPDRVLLDQNFMQDMGVHPIYVSVKTKRLLQRAIWNDTSFLTSIDVMDYSLLIGVDQKRRELVFGIIDYLRQYTWDKKLETWVKASWVLPKNELPTVISPKEYRKRFRKFMSQYFLTIPDA
ncbi:unnamed protein product [Spirodela intermedia]|uniref:1-phosphatidylinositol-3-phosphate 5-kinase n=1 Tax=Spirodela intermedia TaxID=51605 RepID=A0A7I8L7M8_SPIIN|nr:unnamed protein product [Spirodela intermedia]